MARQARRNPTPKSPAKPRARRPAPAAPARPSLLAGGNPQIPKGLGDEPVRAYIAAMPGWKREIGRRLDEVITRSVPAPLGLRKAVKWNSPLYGVERPEDAGWFLGIHCFANYVRVTFFSGASLQPPPPVESRTRGVRSINIDAAWAEDASAQALFADWVRQASRLPGARM